MASYSGTHVQTGLCEGRVLTKLVGKHSPGRLADLNSTLRIHKNAGVVLLYTCDLSAGNVETILGSLISQTSLIGGFQVEKAVDCFLRMTLQFVLWPPHAHTPACAYTHA